ncbi:MAG: aldehyde dehydrogenase EutE [Candidatus Hydrogenedentota bacterium]|nr:MAG: aldehyde dehydrogenase EutE [Candidatus Hydrogenedentota bacterium]
MNISAADIQAIVDEVVREIQQKGVSAGMPNPEAADMQDGIFPDIDSAVEAATKAYYELKECGVNKRIEIIEAIRQVMRDNVQNLANMAVDETGLGRRDDKVTKNLVVINKTPGVECLQAYAYTGDEGLVLVERASWGVIGSITPTTNPSETIICNGISFIAAGNTGVFNPHPRAKNTSAFTVKLMNRASKAVGGPGNLVTAVANPTIESAGQLMKHPKIAMLVVTGGPGVVKAAFQSGKKVVCGGPGNPPSVVDETARLEKAGRDIVKGHSFDNNIICTDEKEVIVVEKVADHLIDVMRAAGGYLINRSQIDRLTQIVLKDFGSAKPGCGGHANPKYVGQDAAKLLREIGINVNQDIRCILAEVPNDHPLIWTEQLMPILPITRVPDVDTGIDLAVRCEHYYNHTASMHSLNLDKLDKMAKTFQGSIFVKNAPNYAGLGEGGSGWTSFTIASPTGDGLTTAITFSRERRCVLADHFRIV